MEVLALIPARGGSKRLPKKNLKLLAGKPLLHWSIKVALQCNAISRVIVTTDSQEIASVAASHGAEVPFLRPASLSEDRTPDFPVFQHALNWLQEQEGYLPDLVVWLRPTVPLRICVDIESAIETLVASGADSIRSVTEAEHHPYWMKQIENNRLLPFLPGKDERVYYQHQLLPQVFRLNGAVDITWSHKALESGNLYGETMAAYVMPRERSIDIDTELDLVMAELLMQSQGGTYAL